MARSDDEKIADESLAMKLLAGFDGTAGEPAYLEKGSPDEAQARAALARIVRDHMHGFSGELLALAIDPETPSSIPGMKATRKAQFESPARGKGSTWARDLLVVNFIRKERRQGNGKLEPCLAAAEQHFQLSRSRVHEIWKAHEQMLETWGRGK